MRLLKFKMSSKTFAQDEKAISSYIYLLQLFVISFHSSLRYQLIGTKANPWVASYIYLLQLSVISFHSSLRYQFIGTKANPWVAVNLQRSVIYSNNTFTLPLTLQLRWKPLSILQTVIKNKQGHIVYQSLVKVLLILQ